MSYLPTTHQLVKELYKLLSTHYCTIVPLMLERKKFFEEIFSHRKGLREYSVTVFDLHSKLFTFHNSSCNAYLKYPSICPEMENGLKVLNEYSEPQNLHFCMDTILKSYAFIQSLIAEERLHFRVLYIRRLQERDGLYHPYLHHMYISEYDEHGNAWLITTESKRLLDMNLPEFRKFSPPTEQYTEEHQYSAKLLTLKLDEIDRELIKKHVEDCKKKELSKSLYRSPHTVSNRYNKVNALFGVKSINTTCLIAKIMELV